MKNSQRCKYPDEEIKEDCNDFEYTLTVWNTVSFLTQVNLKLAKKRQTLNYDDTNEKNGNDHHYKLHGTEELIAKQLRKIPRGIFWLMEYWIEH